MSDMSSRRVYLDYQATTPVDERVLAGMLPYFSGVFGNPSSIDHGFGAEAAAAIEQARERVAALLHGGPRDIIFTSGATEANNMAVLGLAEGYDDKPGHIITAATEHPAVLDPCEYLRSKGWKISVLPVDECGLVDPDAVGRALRPDTRLISIMAANNEIGTVAPIAHIGRVARDAGVTFHCDATQAAGYLEIDMESMSIDLLSFSAHKMYGPKGVGALCATRAARRRIRPRTFGGGHEAGLRSGTLNVPGIVGFGLACEIAAEEMPEMAERLRGLRDGLWNRVAEGVPGLELNGHPTRRLPHNLNMYFPSANARAMMVQLKRTVALSTGSACGSAKEEPSHVVRALGLGDDRPNCSIRASIGHPTSEADVDYAATRILDAYRSLG